MTTTNIDGFSQEHWQELFQSIKAKPQRFVDAMGGLQNASAKSGLLRHQVEMRKKVARKFAEPDRWVWSGDYLQLASDQTTAEMVASHFPPGCQVFDIGCGGGSDAIALASGRSVVAVDKNEFACQLTQCNRLLQNLESFEVRQATAENLVIGTESFVHLDPDRREGSNRSVQMRWHSPNIDTVRQLICDSQGGSIKLAPACSDDPTEFGRTITRQWITMNHSVVQQRWWWGIPVALTNQIWISSFIPSKGWLHEFVDATAPSVPVTTDGTQIKPGMYIGDGDPALRAANCQANYVSAHNCQLIGNQSGFYLSEMPLDLPLIRWFKIAEVIPMDAKRVKKAIRDRDVDAIDLKSRNVLSVPADLTRLSNTKGKYRTTILIFSIGPSHLAVVSEPTL